MPRTTTTPTSRATKARSGTRQAPARTPRPRRQRRNEGLIRDTVSVVLIAVGILSLAALVVPADTGVVGKAIAGALHGFAGSGALCVPLALVITGCLLLVDPMKVSFDEAALGIGLLLISGLSLVQVCGVGPGHDGDRVLRAAYGGWVGATVGGTLRGWTGNVGACILLAALAVFAIILILDQPLPELLRHAGHGASRGAAALRGARGMRGEGDARPRKSPFVDAGAPPEEPARKERKGRAKEAAEEPAIAAALPLPEPLPEPVIQPTLWNATSAKDPDPEPAVELPPPPSKPAGKAKRAAPVAAATEDNAAEGDEPEGPAAPPPPPREFILPPTTLLQVAQVLPEGPGAVTDNARNIRILEETLAQFKIEAKVVEIAQGPTFTRYEIRLAPGIRVNRIESLGDNIAMNLAALDVRIQAPIPGKAAIGIEVPNKSMAMVPLRDVVDAPDFADTPSKLAFALGKDVTGRAWVADLARMPHLLIGGATNSGKSVCLNCLIASILFRVKPDEVKFLLIDPKRVELSLFDGIPHLLHPVITDIRKAAGMLNWAIREMERRYELFATNGCRDIYSYNSRADEDLEHLPFIIIVIDELADMMMQLAAEVEQTICRLAQLARATGIHLVIATQRPSVDVITGLIKANIPSRIAFAVSSHIDSRTILDKRGAERLLGRGDMLYEPIGASKPHRIQGAYVSEKEVETLVEYLRRQATPVYSAEPVEAGSNGSGSGSGGNDADGAEDGLFEDAVRLVVTTRRASTSSLQRKFSIGYTRAARLIDMMEERGIVSALDGSKPREVLASREQIEQFFRSALNAPPEAADDGEDSPFV